MPLTSATRPTSSSADARGGRGSRTRGRRGRSSSTSARTVRASCASGWAPRVDLTTLTEYNEDWSYPVAFPPERPPVTLASFLAERGIDQLHVAETEKYAHVTYFFNGGEEDPYAGEERSLVDSPRDVPTYDHKPEMSAREAAATFVEHWDGARVRLRDHQLREPGHGGPHGLDPGRRDSVRGGRRVPRAGRRQRCRELAAPASSRPITAMPTTCSSRTAARTRRTR